MSDVKSKISLKKKFDDLPDQSRAYLNGLGPLLIDSKNFGISLAYLFMKIEEGQHRALKCGLIRIHNCNSAKVDEVLAKQHFTRATFKKLFKIVMSEDVSGDAIADISKAEKTRDKLIHGKTPPPSELREAISSALNYVVALGSQVETKTKKNPFGDLRGLKGKKELLDPIPTFWIMKGMGFTGDQAV